MTGLPLLLADAGRAEQFLLLGHSRKLFGGYSLHTDAAGLVWATKAVAGHTFAATWLGPGWVFDPAAQQRRVEDLRARRAAMAAADTERHRQELDAAVARMRLGPAAERLLWLVHQQVLRLRTSLLHLPDFLLAEAVWGHGKRPAHWREELRAVLHGLTWLHLTGSSPTEAAELGAETAVLTHAADLRGTPNDVCRGACVGTADRPHHHYLVNVGRGFLGILEVFAQDEDNNGIRAYAFPVGGRRRESASLRKVGKSGRLVTVYLPAKLGDRRACGRLTASQHRLLQALVRETTRTARENRTEASEAEVMQGNRIPTIDGRATFVCGLLEPDKSYVGFNGNKLLKGRGYLVGSPRGWMARAGYAPDQVSAFLADLAVLTDRLALVPVGIQPGNPTCLDVGQLSALASSSRKTRPLGRIHLRVYAPADYLARWNEVFGWQPDSSERTVVTDPVLVVASAIERKVVSQKQLAEGMGVDPSLLNKVLRGKRPWPAGWLDRATSWLSVHIGPGRQPPSPSRRKNRRTTGQEVVKTPVVLQGG
jgi:hypothetical protein